MQKNVIRYVDDEQFFKGTRIFKRKNREARDEEDEENLTFEWRRRRQLKRTEAKLLVCLMIRRRF